MSRGDGRVSADAPQADLGKESLSFVSGSDPSAPAAPKLSACSTGTCCAVVECVQQLQRSECGSRPVDPGAP